MSSDIILIIVAIIAFVIAWKVLKPYFIKYDTTILFIGGLGSGKTLNSVNEAITLLKKVRMSWYLGKLKNDFLNLFRKKAKKVKYNVKKPCLYSNIPIVVKKPLFSKKIEYSVQLTKEHLTLKDRIIEHSVVLIDEMPLLVNQFNWNQEEVKNNLNEFIALFRHYVGGFLILNGQAESEIVKQVRVKLNVYYWCFNFRKFLCFYKVSLMQNRVSEETITLSSEFTEENTKNKYGILTKKYNSRCYAKRYLKVPYTDPNNWNSKDLTTNRIISFNKEVSILNEQDK